MTETSEKTNRENRKSPEKLLRAGELIQIRPRGWSMYPLFVPGRDWAVIAPVRERTEDEFSEKNRKTKQPRFRSTAALHRGDVVLYRRENGMLVLHRILRVYKNEFWLAGDNQTDAEKGIRQEQILGVLCGFVRKGRRHSCREFLYRFFSCAWMLLLPLRRLHFYFRKRKRKP